MAIASFEGKESDPQTLRVSAVLCLFSFISLIEGAFRFYGANPNTETEDLDGDENTFPPILNLITAVFYLFFALTGFGIGIQQLFFDIGDAKKTMVVFYIRMVTGTLAFVVDALARPIFSHEKMLGNPNFPAGAWDNQSEENAAFVFGRIFPLLGLCTTTIGMNLLVTRMLAQLQEGKAQPLSTNTLRYFSGAVFISGLGTFILGCMVSSKDGLGELDSIYFYPPNVVHYPILTILTGLALTVYGVLGLIGNKGTCGTMSLFAPFLWFWILTAQIMTNTSTVGDIPPLPLLFTAVFTGHVLAPMFCASQVLRFGE